MPYTIEELLSKAEANDPRALYELALKMLSGEGVERDSETARKYLVFSVQLGNTDACLTLGELYLSEGQTEKAAEVFKRGLMAGNGECAVRYAILKLDDDEASALDILMENASAGDKLAVQSLVDFFTGAGNKKEAEFWKKKLKKF